MKNSSEAIVGMSGYRGIGAERMAAKDKGRVRSIRLNFRIFWPRQRIKAAFMVLYVYTEDFVAYIHEKGLYKSIRVRYVTDSVHTNNPTNTRFQIRKKNLTKRKKPF